MKGALLSCFLCEQPGSRLLGTKQEGPKDGSLGHLSKTPATHWLRASLHFQIALRAESKEKRLWKVLEEVSEHNRVPGAAGRS